MHIGKTFFSYSRVDSEFALRLATDLRESGANVWLDQLDIKAGSHWDKSIQAALENASCVIFILSPDSVASDNVMDEVSFALGNGKAVIPVLKTNCKVPFRISRLQQVDFSKNYKRGLDELKKALNLSAVDSFQGEGTNSKIQPAVLPDDDITSKTASDKIPKKENGNKRPWYAYLSGIRGVVAILLLFTIIVIIYFWPFSKKSAEKSEEGILKKENDTAILNNHTKYPNDSLVKNVSYLKNRFEKESFIYNYQGKFGIIPPDRIAALSKIVDFINKETSLKDIRHVAYILATIKYETADLFLPFIEPGKGANRPWGKIDTVTGKIYYGRGYTLLTNKNNYEKLNETLKLKNTKYDLVKEPDNALSPHIAFRITYYAMLNGLFTGKKLSDYINLNKTDYLNARRICNGLDRAEPIAKYARDFESILEESNSQKESN